MQTRFIKYNGKPLPFLFKMKNISKNQSLNSITLSRNEYLETALQKINGLW